MKPILSPLEVVDFSIINSLYKFVQPEPGIDVLEIMTTYELDVNYRFETEKNFWQVFVKIAVNQIEGPKPGYCIFAEGVTFFQFNALSKLNENEKRILMNYSALPMAIHCVRGYIANLTAGGPYGKYLFPLIDLNDLMRQKELLIKEKMEKTASSSPKPMRKLSQRKKPKSAK
ncbi:MAG: hypothetical protein M3R17_15615 [Bacteroidota bacterium]|nr:hypothetical protein [Bacteroidota bacterium]